MSLDTGGGAGIGGNVTAGSGVTGRDAYDHRGSANVNLHFDSDRPATERERVDWRDRQIVELRYALLGDDKFGVSGLVDAVRNQWIWLVIMTILVFLVAVVLIWQQFQIHQIQFQMQEILQRLNRL